MEKRTDVQISRTQEGVVVSITSKPSWVDRFVALFLSVWLVGWLFGEVSVIAVLVRGVAVSDLGARALTYGFLMLWLAAWTMGGFFVASTLSWMFFGRETVTFSSNTMRVELHGVPLLFMRPKVYELAEIKDVGVVPDRLANRRRRPLFPGHPSAGAIAFSYRKRTSKFGIALDAGSAEQLLRDLRSYNLLVEG